MMVYYWWYLRKINYRKFFV